MEKKAGTERDVVCVVSLSGCHRWGWAVFGILSASFMHAAMTQAVKPSPAASQEEQQEALMEAE